MRAPTTRAVPRLRPLVVVAGLALLVVPAILTEPGDGTRPAGAHASPVEPPAPAPAPAHEPLDIADAVERVLRTTVLFEGDGIYGSGILIDPARGLVLTSHHVVSDMRTPRVTAYDGRKGTARIIASDRKLDIAIVSCPELVSPDLPPPVLGDAWLLRPGDEVYAIGSPRKLPFTVSRGIVSFVGRRMEGARFLQVDMSINDGNSGGPVFNRRGEVVGVMSFILRRSQGLSFALPIGYAAEAFPEHVAAPAPRPEGRRVVEAGAAGR